VCVCVCVCGGRDRDNMIWVEGADGKGGRQHRVGGIVYAKQVTFC
jgi:hypothetical protein